MGRKHKGHDERRHEILDGAWELFTTRGYEKGTVAAIIDRVGISKGTFYHYFSSKEEVLDAITDRLASEPLEELRRVVDDESLAAGPKLDRFVEVARQARARRVGSVLDVARVLYREENLLVRHKITERLTEVTLPLLQTIVQQGVDEGAFRVSSPAEAARVFWHLSNIFADEQMRTLLADRAADDKVPELVARAELVADSLERILGATPGTITRPSPRVLELFARAVDADRAARGPS